MIPTMLKEDFKRVKKLVSEAIEKAREKSFDEPVNWGDLKCIEILYAYDENHEDEFIIIIDEAGPNCYEFQNFIRKELRNEDITARVITEW